MSKIIQIASTKVIDLTGYRIKAINTKYHELKEKLNKLDEQKVNLSITAARVDKTIYQVKLQIENLEKEILKNIKG